MADYIRAAAGVGLFTLLGIIVSGCSSPSAPSPAQRTSTSGIPVDRLRAPSPSYSTPGVFGPSAINFPPRDEPNAFFQDMIALYRNVLGRSQSSPTFVNPEGENVWLTEYFRFYLNGCPHEQAVSRTLSEITGGTQPVCGAETPDFPPRNLPNAFQAQLEATYRDVLHQPQTLSYVDSEGANVWLAEYLRFRVSGCGHGDAENKTFIEIRGGAIQPACATVSSSTTTTPRSSISTTTTTTPSSSTTTTTVSSSTTSSTGTTSIPALSGSIAIQGTPCTAAKSCTFVASASGGQAPYTYAWTFSGNGSSASDSGQQVQPALGCNFLNLSNPTTPLNISLRITASSGSSIVVPGSTSLARAGSPCG